MKCGLTIFPTDYTIGPGELAAVMEERGFESLWVPEHSHFPVSPLTPGRDSGGLPNMYYDLMDPFVALAMAAEATDELLLGTSICLVVQRDPLQLAKVVASLDSLSGGRFLFGVGGGWNPMEMADHGTPFAERLAIMRERIEAMKELWTQEQAEYHGKYVNFAPSYAWPKPARKPHPPIHVAANAPKGLARVVAYGDGWFPLMDENDQGAVFDHLSTLRDRLKAAGRDPASVEVSVYMCPPKDEVVTRCRDEGIDRVIFLLDPKGREEVLEQVDNYAELMGRCS